MALIYQSGYVFKDDGTAVEGATVQLYQTDSSTLVTFSDASSTSTTTNSDGYYSASVTEVGATSGYDVKVTSGSSIRYRRGNDRLQIEELDIRNDTGATQGGLYVANTTNSASVKVATFAGMRTTANVADNDEIYMSFEMKDDGGALHEYARITAEANDVSDGNEDGELKFGVSVGGSIVNVFSVNASTAGVTDMTLDVSGDLTLDAGDGDIFFKDGGTTFGSATNNSGELIIKSGTTTALTFSGSSVTIGGDLTISGDDLVMATNTSGYVLVADGTNYNPVAVSGDVTMANDGAVTIASGSVETAMIAADAITAAKIADDVIDSEHYVDGSIDNAHLADDAVDSDELAAGAVDTAHIADNNVTAAKIFDLARGSIIVGNASAATAELTVGSEDQVLTTDSSGDAVWATAAAGGISVGKSIALSMIF